MSIPQSPINQPPIPGPSQPGGSTPQQRRPSNSELPLTERLLQGQPGEGPLVESPRKRPISIVKKKNKTGPTQQRVRMAGIVSIHENPPAMLRGTPAELPPKLAGTASERAQAAIDELDAAIEQLGQETANRTLDTNGSEYHMRFCELVDLEKRADKVCAAGEEISDQGTFIPPAKLTALKEQLEKLKGLRRQLPLDGVMVRQLDQCRQTFQASNESDVKLLTPTTRAELVELTEEMEDMLKIDARLDATKECRKQMLKMMGRLTPFLLADYKKEIEERTDSTGMPLMISDIGARLLKMRTILSTPGKFDPNGEYRQCIEATITKYSASLEQPAMGLNARELATDKKEIEDGMDSKGRPLTPDAIHTRLRRMQRLLAQNETLDPELEYAKFLLEMEKKYPKGQ